MNLLRTRHPVAVALLVGGAIAALVPAGAAVALDSPPTTVASIDVRSAQLVAKGAAADVTVAYVCPAGSFASGSVQVTQRSGPEVTTGSTFVTFPCTGAEAELVLRVSPTGGLRAFKSGDAAIRASLNTCGFGFCGTVTDDAVISIRR